MYANLIINLNEHESDRLKFKADFNNKLVLGWRPIPYLNLL